MAIDMRTGCGGLHLFIKPGYLPIGCMQIASAAAPYFAAKMAPQLFQLAVDLGTSVLFPLPSALGTHQLRADTALLIG